MSGINKIMVGILVGVMYLSFSFPTYAYEGDICHYISGLRIDTTAPKPQLFSNVDKIYINPIIGEKLQRLDHAILNKEVISQISKCQIHNRTNITSYIGEITQKNDPKAISVYPVIDVMSRFGNETIFNPDKKLISLVVSYDRYKIPREDLFRKQCLSVFPLESTDTIVLKHLSKAIAKCMNNQYSNHAIDPDFWKALKIN